MNAKELHLVVKLLTVGLVDADPNTLHHIKEYRDLRGSKSWEGSCHSEEYRITSHGNKIEENKGDNCSRLLVIVVIWTHLNHDELLRFCVLICMQWWSTHLNHLFWRSLLEWTKRKWCFVTKFITVYSTLAYFYDQEYKRV